MLRISSKAEFFKLSTELKLGNRLNRWTHAEFIAKYVAWVGGKASMPELIGIRSAFVTNNRKTGLYTPRDAYETAVVSLPDSEKWLFDEGAPNEHIVLQGEVMADEQHLYLRWTTDPRHMRRAFEEDSRRYDVGESVLFQHARGLTAWNILKSHMDASSWDCFQDILRTYEHPIIEFCCLRKLAGVLRWNTIFWEVRTHY